MSGQGPAAPTRPVLPDAPEFGSREARASLALKVIAVAYIVGILLAEVRGSLPVSMLLTVAFNVAAGVLAILYLILARGIDRHRPWASMALKPVLALLAVASAYAMSVALLNGTIRVPYELALAVWAWLGMPDQPANLGARKRPALGMDRPATGIDRRGVALVLVAVVMAAEMAFGQLVFGWGGALDVHPQDLVADLQVSCGAPGGGAPPAITIAYAWSWTRGAPLPNEVDTVLVGWSAADTAGRPIYAIDDIPDTGSGIRPGYGDLTRPMVDAARADVRSAYRWAIDLAVRRYAPGEVRLGLIITPVATPPATGTLEVRATYVHLDQWRVDAAPVTCSW